MMNRRKFLRCLGLAPVAAVAAVVLPKIDLPSFEWQGDHYKYTDRYDGRWDAYHNGRGRVYRHTWYDDRHQARAAYKALVAS